MHVRLANLLHRFCSVCLTAECGEPVNNRETEIKTVILRGLLKTVILRGLKKTVILRGLKKTVILRGLQKTVILRELQKILRGLQ